MIIESIYDDYGRRAAERKFRGNPTGSQLGACTASLQFQRFPAQSRPEPLRARDLIRFDHGHIEEEWLNDDFKRAIPGLTGLRQEPFYFAVPLDAAAAAFQEIYPAYNPGGGIRTFLAAHWDEI